MSGAIWQIHDVQAIIIDDPSIPDTNCADDVARETGIQVEEIMHMLPFVERPQKLYKLRTVKKFSHAYGEAVANKIAKVPEF